MWRSESTFSGLRRAVGKWVRGKNLDGRFRPLPGSRLPRIWRVPGGGSRVGQSAARSGSSPIRAAAVPRPERAPSRRQPDPAAEAQWSDWTVSLGEFGQDSTPSNTCTQPRRALRRMLDLTATGGRLSGWRGSARIPGPELGTCDARSGRRHGSLRLNRSSAADKAIFPHQGAYPIGAARRVAGGPADQNSLPS